LYVDCGYNIMGFWAGICWPDLVAGSGCQLAVGTFAAASTTTTGTFAFRLSIERPSWSCSVLFQAVKASVPGSGRWTTLKSAQLSRKNLTLGRADSKTVWWRTLVVSGLWGIGVAVRRQNDARL